MITFLKRFVHAKYTRTYCVPTIHGPNKFNDAFVISIIRDELDTSSKSVSRSDGGVEVPMY